MTASNALDLPTVGKLLERAELTRAYENARDVFDRIKSELQEQYPVGTLVLVDGDDASGKTFTVGSDMLAVEQKHWKTFRKPLHTACFFKIGDD